MPGYTENIFMMSKQKIVLINPSNPDPPPNYFGPPYGLSLIGAVLEREGRPVSAYDFDLEPASTMLSSVKEIIRKEKPRYVGITIQSCTRGPVYDLVRMIKSIDKTITIILGGPFVTQAYELLLKNFPVDYAVIGDGETTLSRLLDCLENAHGVGQVDGVAFIDDGCVRVTRERKKDINLDLLPYPAFHLFRGFEKKINSSREENESDFVLGRRCTTLKNALLLLSSRGCIYGCNFCPMSKITKHKIRFHSPAYFVDMVGYFYQKYGIRNFVFGDNNFTFSRPRVVEICERIVKKGLKIKWSCMTRSDSVDLKLLKAMSCAGCFEISYGVESGSEAIQRAIGKNLDLAATKRAFRLTKKSGIRSVLMLMIGNLNETEKTVKETLSFIRDLDPDTVLVKIVKVYPGTRIHDIFEHKGLLAKDYYLAAEPNPPFFTIKHSKAELERMAAMINTRVSFIRVNNICNNNCFSCGGGSKRSKGLSQIKKELFLASRRGDHVVLCGGEPFLRNEIWEIIDHADKLDIHHLYSYTNARRFCYPAFAKKAGGTNLRKLIISIFGAGGCHDRICGAKGAFSQTIEGIKNLRSFAGNIKIQPKIYISRSNYKELSGLCKILISAGADEIGLVFLKDNINQFVIGDEHILSLSMALPEIEKAVKVISAAKKYSFFEGLPSCSIRRFKSEPQELFYPFNETIGMDGKLVNCRSERARQKKKFSFCKLCKENPLCEGIWKEYADVYGGIGLKNL